MVEKILLLQEDNLLSSKAEHEIKWSVRIVLYGSVADGDKGFNFWIWINDVSWGDSWKRLPSSKNTYENTVQLCILSVKSSLKSRPLDDAFLPRTLRISNRRKIFLLIFRN